MPSSTSEPQYKPSSLAALTNSIYLECIENAIRDVAAEAHRQHKIQAREALSARHSDPLQPVPRENGDAAASAEVCSHCRLPRLDSLSAAQRAIVDPKRYCSRVSVSAMGCAGVDIYGASFEGGVKKSKKSEKDNGSMAGLKNEEGGTRPSTPKPKDSETKSYWKCTECGSEIAGRRFAAHLEKCLGISGRGTRKTDNR